VVEAIGPGVPKLRVGARVGYAGAASPGAYADRRVVPAWRLLPIPDAIDDVTAAALLLKGLTAEYLLRRTFRVGPGHRVLVHAAAGGVGLLLCQWLRHLGATVFGAVSTDAKAELAQAHGCHHPIVTTRDDFVAVVRTVTRDQGVDVVYDSVGQATVRGSLDCLRRRGMLVLFGNSSGPPGPIDPLELGRRGSLFLTRPSLHDYVSTRQELLRAGSALFAVVAQGVVRPRVDRTLPLADAAAAHRLLESRATAGALVLLP
jgi:NADPH2:quinone reductase